MLYDAVRHANLQSVIPYPYPIRICGIVENDIRIDRIHKNSRISANIYPRFHIRAPLMGGRLRWVSSSFAGFRYLLHRPTVVLNNARDLLDTNQTHQRVVLHNLT